MIATIANAFSVPEIRRKILFTCAILALYRLGAFIPVPGVNVDAVENVGDSFSGSNILGFLNLFSGGGLQNFAVFSLGIMPYITASIILQLLTVAVPIPGEAPEGRRGRPAEDHAVHALPDGGAGLGPIGRLRVPVPHDRPPVGREHRRHADLLESCS